MNKDKKKPIMFLKSGNKYYRNNKFQQNLLLKSLQYTDDLDKLKEIAGFHSKVEVLRTLDKLSIRRGYHEALESSGLNIDHIVKKYKDLSESNNEKIALGAINAVSKSLGLDKYEVSDNSGKNWEELLLEAEKITGASSAKKIGDKTQYEVEQPEVPEEEKKKEEEEKELGRSIYE